MTRVMCPESWHIMMMYSNDLGQNTKLSRVKFLQSFPSDHLEIWQNSHVKFPAFYASRCEFTCDFLASQTQQLGSHQKPLDKKSTRQPAEIQSMAASPLEMLKSLQPQLAERCTMLKDVDLRLVLIDADQGIDKFYHIAGDFWICLLKNWGWGDWNLIKEIGRWFSHDKFSSFDCVDVCSW